MDDVAGARGDVREGGAAGRAPIWVGPRAGSASRPRRIVAERAARLRRGLVAERCFAAVARRSPAATRRYAGAPGASPPESAALSAREPAPDGCELPARAAPRAGAALRPATSRCSCCGSVLLRRCACAVRAARRVLALVALRRRALRRLSSLRSGGLFSCACMRIAGAASITPKTAHLAIVRDIFMKSAPSGSSAYRTLPSKPDYQAYFKGRSFQRTLPHLCPVGCGARTRSSVAGQAGSISGCGV